MKKENENQKKEKGLSKNAIKTIASLLISFAIVFLIYVLILKFEFKPGYHLLYVVTGLLSCTVVILNGGFSKGVPRKDQLRDDWDDDKKERFINRIVKGKETAKKLMIVLVPLLVVVFIDIISLYWIKS
ncbi:MAG: hypothetical protein J5850_01275 [Clostridia bacterium]|nr:hypothetical protein [Clostridia bacterium]